MIFKTFWVLCYFNCKVYASDSQSGPHRPQDVKTKGQKKLWEMGIHGCGFKYTTLIQLIHV